MARSNTLPISRPQLQENNSYKAPSRSATTIKSSPKNQHALPNLPFHQAQPSASTASQRTATPPTRPAGPNRTNTAQTRYVEMLLALDTIPRIHNIAASFFTWILLAGFIIFPGTFTSIQSLGSNPLVSASHAATEILHEVKHIQLLVVAGVCCGIGAAGMIWLWWRWRENFVWLLNKIFLPGCLNSVAGLISTLVNVYSQQGGAWSITARVTAIVTGSVMVISGCLFGIYNFWVLARVKKRHERELERFGVSSGGGHEGEGLVEKIERKVHAPPLEPGSVI